MKKTLQKSSNEAFESMLHLALEEAAKEICDSNPIPDEPVEFSEEHKRKMELIFEKAEKKDKLRYIGRITRMCACILLVLSLSAALTVPQVRSVCKKAFDFVFDKESSYSEINISQREYIGDYVMNYIPGGFKAINKNIGEFNSNVTFSNGERQFELCIDSHDSSIIIDTENAEFENLSINECEAFYSKNENINILMWYHNSNYIVITGNIDKKTIIKIAENVVEKQ